MPQRREPGDPRADGAEVADREERAGEQEEREDAEPEEHPEALLGLHPGREGVDQRRERHADQDLRREGEERPPPGLEDTERRQHQHEHRAGRRQPERDEQQVRGDEVADWQRRGEHRVVDPLPLDHRHHGVRRLAHRGLHGVRRDQPGHDEREVGRRALELGRVALDEAAEQHAHRDDVEERRRRRRRSPSRARCACRRSTSSRTGGRCPRRSGRPTGRTWCSYGRHQSTSVRPVRRRKTSSSVERRTSTATGSRPRSCTLAMTSSPSSV